jgi:hypothetical protein
MRNAYKKCGRKSIGSYHVANVGMHGKVAETGYEGVHWIRTRPGQDPLQSSCTASGSARVGNSLASCVSIEFARHIVQQGSLYTALLVTMTTKNLRHPAVQIGSDNSSRVMGPHRSGKHRDLHYRNLQPPLCLAQSLEVRVPDRLRYVMPLFQAADM